MGRALQNIEPKLVWSIFEDLCQVPRPSKKEEKIIKYMKDWAAQHNFAVKEDATGNFVIKKPATPGMENRKTICIQGHVDMVCEKNADVEFNFDTDPIQCYVDGDWVKARGTTLGADNGLGVAMGMAILQSTDIAHPNIELLCTLDEETGLTGAMGLSTDLLEAEILINLDSEEDGAFTIGCAGGLNTFGHYKYESTEVPENYVAYKVAVRGLRGGHSGIEIHTGRANAAKFLNRLLWNLTNKFDILLSDFNSGNKHNAIPREGFATVLVPKTKEADFLAYVELFHKQSFAEYSSVEPNLRINAETTGAPTKAMAKDFQKRLLHSFYAMPHGVYRMSPEIKGLVQTSTNFAIIETREDEVYVLTSQRSSVESEKIDMANVVKCAMELGGATTEFSDGYPAWEPNMKSSILNRGVEIYKALFGKDPHIEAIHAGLECGLVGEKYPDMDMISFGPDLRDVHSPDEMASIPSTEKTWKFLVELVKNTPVK